MDTLPIAAITGIVTFIVEDIRHRRNSKRQLAAQDATKQLLQSPDWKQRSFESIKARLGGFEDNELRKILVSVGAVRFKGGDGTEHRIGEA